MSNIVIKFENISKQYRLGQIGTGTLSHDLNRWMAKIRGKEDPYLKIGETNNRAHKGESDYVWALRDIDFEVNKGEVLGIIGKNGAGKSTLLKILSKVTKPTTGIIKANGRIASLLEVGTGFHSEMTGRENIYLNGAIMGMTKSEITRKFDEIVEFAGVERYIDTPTKRYSSGMTVRLGFSIAAHLEPDILIVDEVLAVGDAEFQKKAIGKMKDVSKGEGRTVLFVSHNMASIGELCKSGMVLEDGQIAYQGSVTESIEHYLNANVMYEPVLDVSQPGDYPFRKSIGNKVLFNKITAFNHFKNPGLEFFIGKPFSFQIEFETSLDITELEIGIGIKNGIGVGLGVFVSNWSGFKDDFNKGLHKVEIEVPYVYLTPGNYLVSFWLREQRRDRILFDQLSNCIEFTIVESNIDGKRVYLHNYRPYHLTQKVNWKYLS